MRRLSLLIVFLLLINLVSALQTAPESFTYGYQPSWETYENQTTLNWSYDPPANYNISEFELSRNDWETPQIVEYYGWGFYEDNDITVGEEYTYSLRVFLISEVDASADSTDYAVVTVDTSEISDLLDPPNNFSLGSTMDWENNKIPVIYWDYTPPTGYTVDNFYIQRADEEFPQMSHMYEEPWYYEDYNAEDSQIYYYTVKAMISNHEIMYSVITEFSVSYEVDTSSLPLSSLNYSGNMPGEYNDVPPITLSSNEEDVEIYYTLDGTDPTTSDNLYSDAITIPWGGETTIKGRAFKTGEIPSAILSLTYTVSGLLSYLRPFVDQENINHEYPIFSWDSMYSVEGYYLTIGTTPGSSDILNNYYFDEDSPGYNDYSSNRYTPEVSLERGTEYYWVLTAKQEDTEFVISNPEQSFFTANDITINSFPYSEGFEDTAQGELPSGWTDINYGYTYAWSVSNSDSYSGNNSISLYLGGQDDWLFSAPIEMKEGKKYQINFQVKSSQLSIHNVYLVSETSLLSDDNPIVVADLGTFNAHNSWSLISSEYDSYEDQTLFLAFKPNSSIYTYIRLDMLTISENYLPIEAPSASLEEDVWYDSPFTLELTHPRLGTQIFYYLVAEENLPYDFATNFSSDKILYVLPVELNTPGAKKLYIQALNPEWDPSPIEEYDLLIRPTLLAPQFSIDPGIYNDPLTIELISEVSDVAIYYTLDGSDPIVSATRILYTEENQIEIALSESITIKAYSEKENYMNSEVITGYYYTLPKLDVVSFSPEPGNYCSAQLITLSNEEGTSIYYTLGDEVPTDASTLYSEPLVLGEQSETMIQAIAYKAGYEASDVVEATYTITGQVATPTPSVDSGIYPNPLTITLASETIDSEIRYTTDGSQPTTESMLYEGVPFVVDNFSSLTIKALAVKENWANSEVMEAQYEVTGQLTEVVFSHESGDYENMLNLSFSVPDYPTASIYYTTNNTAPTSESNLYEGQIVLNSPSEVTIQAIAVLANYLDSEPVTHNYQVRNRVATPIFSLAEGVYSSNEEVVISSPTTSATIYYTLDGTDPVTGILYTNPITLDYDSNYSFRAIAIRSGWYNSDEASAEYQITGTVDTPDIDTDSGIYYEAITVNVLDIMEGAEVRYTLDGTSPTIASELYVDPFVFNPGEDVTLTITAFRDDWGNSKTISRWYTLPDETYISDLSLTSYTITPEDNPEFHYAILTNHTAANVTSIITIINESNVEVATDSNVDMIFSGITNSFSREVTALARGFAEGTYFYRLDVLNIEGDTLDTLEPSAPFVVGTPSYTIAGEENVDFGLVSAGSINTHSFTINSTGSLALEIATVEPDLPFSVSFIPSIIAVGSSTEITVTFNPISYGTYSDELILTTTAGEITCSFSGQAVMGQYRDNISAISATIDFGTLIDRNFTIFNDSPAADLNVELVETESWISLSNDIAVIAAGDSQIVTVSLSEVDLPGGEYSANLTINTDDLNNEQVIIPINLIVNGAVITVSDNPIEVITGVGVDVDYKFSIENEGPEALNYNLTDGADWLVADDANGIIGGNSAEPNELHFDGNIAVGTYTTDIIIQSNDVDTPELTIPVTFIVQDAIFGYLPANGELNFGNVAVGSSKSLEITLKNTGNIPLTVNSVISADPAFTLNPEIEDLELEGGSQQVVEVIFTPIATIFYNNIDLEITYDDVNLVNFAMFGRGEDPNPSFSIDWDDNIHDFGNVELGSTETQILRLFNTGNVELHFADFDFEDSDLTSVDDEDFSLDVGKDYTLEVSFSPDVVGEQSLDITLNTTELATQTATVIAVVFQNSNTSTLTYSEEDPYEGTDGVNPITGIAGTNFEFQVIYTDADNQAPALGYPLFYLDLNHDGDTDDENELVLDMDEIDVDDVTFSDGKAYNCFVEVPYGYNPYYKFVAYDVGFKESIGEATNWKAGPVVVDEGLDLGLYASHIEFDNYHPEVGEEVQVTAHIQNWGDMSAEDVPVTFLLDEVVFDIMVIDFIAGNSSVTLETSVIPLEEGFIPVKVHVNRNNANIALVEDNNLNNFASRPLVVGDVVVPGSIDVTATASPGTLYENSGQNFTVYGSAEYVDVLDPNLDVSGSFVRITIRETGEVFTTHTNSWGNYSYTMRAPNPVGLYNIDVYVTDYTLEGTTSTTLNIIPRPDRNDIRIQVDTDYYEYARVNPPTDDTFHIYVSVSNIGTVDINNDITVNLDEDIAGMGGANLTNWLIAGGLNSGQSQSFEYIHPGVGVEGWYYFHGQATHAGIALEDYTNNNYENEKKYIYPALPDLSPTQIYFTGLPSGRNHGVVGRPFVGNVIVKNLLVTESAPTTAKIEYKGPAVGDVWTDFSLIDVPALTAFQQVGLDYDSDILIPVGQAGFYEFRVTVDPPLPGIVVEDDETNNVRTKTIEVKNPDWDFSIRYNSVEISNYNPNFGVGEVNFTADIENTGTDSAEDVEVKFEYAPYENGVVVGAWQQIGNLVVIPEIGSNGIVYDVTSDSWLVPDSEGYLLRVVVDPDDDFAEYNEHNNDRERWLGYEFYPWAHSDYYSTTVGSSSTVGRYVSSRASWKADNVRVVFYDWFPNEPFAVGAVPEQIDVNQMVNIPGNEGTTIARASKVWNEIGTHKITCHVDITGAEIVAGDINPNLGNANHFVGDYDNEIYESNNVDSFIMVVYEQLPDLVAWSEFINPELLNPDENEEITIQSSFENQGSGDIEDDFEIKFYIDSVQLGEPITVNGIDAGTNGAKQATSLFSSPVSGAHVIRVELDTNDDISESNESNNLASRVLIVGPAPNMVFWAAGGARDATTIELSDSSPSVGQAITITANIKNEGRYLGAGWVDFYHVIASDSTLIASREFSADVDEIDEVSINWTATSEFGSIVSVIRDVTPMEYNDLDNSAEVEFGPTLQFVASFSNSEIEEDEGSQLIGNLTTIIENRDNSQVIFFATANVEGAEVTLDQDYQLWVNPPADYYGTIVVSVEALNIYDDSIEADFSIIVNNVNDLPVMTLPESFTITNDGTTTEDFLPYLSDVDDAEVTLTIAVEENDNVAVAIMGVEIDFTPIDSFEGETTIFFSVTDGHSDTVVSDSVSIIVIDNNNSLAEADDLDLTETEFDRSLPTSDIDFYMFTGNSDLKYFELTVLEDENLEINTYYSSLEDGSDINLNSPDYQVTNNEKLEVEVAEPGYWFIRVSGSAPAKSKNAITRSRSSNEYTIVLKTLVTPKNIAVIRDGEICTITWDIVTAANSYKIYRVEYLDEEWGEPYAIIDTNSFVDENTDYNQITNASHKAVYFYKIVASTEEAIPTRRTKINRKTQVGNSTSNLK